MTVAWREPPGPFGTLSSEVRLCERELLRKRRSCSHEMNNHLPGCSLRPSVPSVLRSQDFKPTNMQTDPGHRLWAEMDE